MQAIVINRILTIHQEITIFKSLLQEEGIDTSIPDETLRYVIPKFSSENDLKFTHLFSNPDVDSFKKLISMR